MGDEEITSYPIVGNIVWAKLPSYAAWPAQVVEPDAPSPAIRRRLEELRKEDEVILVQFFEPKKPL